MATIKYQEDAQGNKKVIISVVGSETKVSCECCSSSCPAYPAYPVEVGFDEDGNPTFDQWTADSANLPDSINFFGTTLSKSGTSYGDTSNGVFLEGEKWAVYRNGVRTEKDHLISGGIKDLFLDQYTATWPKFDETENYTVTMVRFDNCTWNAPFIADGCPVGSSGGARLEISDQGWSFSVIVLTSPNVSCYAYGDGKYPGYPQNDPTGTWIEVAIS
jgi:hypothetical protein